MIKTIAKFTTSKGNEIEIYTTPAIGEKGCVVLDHSCQIEKVYWLGQDTYLNWEQLENGYEPLQSLQDVVDAWKNEEIHF
jgi:hypothetical protein